MGICEVNTHGAHKVLLDHYALTTKNGAAELICELINRRRRGEFHMETLTTKNEARETDLQEYLDIIRNLSTGDIAITAPGQSHIIAEMAFDHVEETTDTLIFWLQTSNVLDYTSNFKIVIDDIVAILDQSERLNSGSLGLEVITGSGMKYSIVVSDEE